MLAERQIQTFSSQNQGMSFIDSNLYVRGEKLKRMEKPLKVYIGILTYLPFLRGWQLIDVSV